MTIRLLFFVVSFLCLSLPLTAQKVLVESLSEEYAEEKTQEETTEQTRNEDQAIVSVVPNASEKKVDISLFQKLQPYDSFEKVIQSFTQLNCKNEFVSPLVLQCYVCSFEAGTTKWVLDFHRKEVGDESCDLAGIAKWEKNADQFKDTRQEFNDFITESFSAPLKKTGAKWVSGTDQEDFQVYSKKVFSNKKNDFEEYQILQMQFLYSMINQEKINNSLDQMRNAFSTLRKKALEDFKNYLFSDDSTQKQKKLFDTYLSLIKTSTVPQEEPKVENTMNTLGLVAEDEELKRLGDKLELLRSISFHYGLESKQEAKSCYGTMLSKLLPLELNKQQSEEFKVYEFLKITENMKSVRSDKEVQIQEGVSSEVKTKLNGEKLLDDKKKVLEVSAKPESTSPIQSDSFEINLNLDAFKDEKGTRDYCEPIKYLNALNGKDKFESKVCNDLTGYFLRIEKRYKNFFKGDDDEAFQMYRAELVKELMLASESEYFQELKAMDQITRSAEVDAEALKEAAQRIEFAISKISDYQEELMALLPYLESPLKMRREWLIKGVRSPQVFPLCD